MSLFKAHLFYHDPYSGIDGFRLVFSKMKMWSMQGKSMPIESNACCMS